MMYFKDDVIRCVAGVDPITWSILSIATSSFFYFFLFNILSKESLDSSPLSTKGITTSKLKLLNSKYHYICVNRHVCQRYDFVSV